MCCLRCNIKKLQLVLAMEHLAQSRVIWEGLESEHELALTLTEEAALLEGDAQCKALKRAYEILARLGASIEAEGVKRLREAYGWSERPTERLS